MFLEEHCLKNAYRLEVYVIERLCISRLLVNTEIFPIHQLIAVGIVVGIEHATQR